MSTPVRPVTELPRTVPVGLARTTLRAVQRTRTTIVFGLVLVLFVALLVRLGKVQLVGGAGYRGMVDNQRSIVNVTPLRGAILDRVGRVLALSRPVRNVFVEAGGIIDRKTDSVLLAVEDVRGLELRNHDGLPSQWCDRSAAGEDAGCSRLSVSRSPVEDRLKQRNRRSEGLPGSCAERSAGAARAVDVDRQMDRDDVADVEVLRVTHLVLDGHDVPAVLREERRGEVGLAHRRGDRDHPPAVADSRGRRLDGTALVVGDGDEVVRRRSAPEPDLAAELELHAPSIGAGGDTSTARAATSSVSRDQAST